MADGDQDSSIPPLPTAWPPSLLSQQPGTWQPAPDPDAGFVKGTQIPVSLAKQFVRAFEPNQQQGYLSAWGMPGGLTGNEPVDQYGFPTQAAYPGAPIGKAYGGKYGGQVSHAAGMYQLEPGVWQTAVQGLAREGTNISDFSPGAQEQVGSWLLRTQGIWPWARFNNNLSNAWNGYLRTGAVPPLPQPQGLLAAAGP